MKVVGKGRGLF